VVRDIITLTTDFGAADHFVGAMKGVILSIRAGARIVDITHEVQPYDIPGGGFAIAQACGYFPKKTIHVVVVDPGVGSTRRALLAEIAGQYFVAPDNGVLSMLFARDPAAKVRHITNERYFLKPVSRTFHGRDVFAPVAAHLASGVAPSRFGTRIADYIKQSFDGARRTGKKSWSGSVLKIDRFGNAITNLHSNEIPTVKNRAFTLKVGTARVTRLASTFSEGPEGEPFVIVGSSGFLEIAMNQGSAAAKLGVSPGAPVELSIN
jgi:S-adenosylmethionine hydrolase